MSKEAQIVREIIEEGPKKKAFQLSKEDSLELFRLSRDLNRAVAEGRLPFDEAKSGYSALIAKAKPDEVALKKVAPKPGRKEEPPDTMGLVAQRMKEEEAREPPAPIPSDVDASALAPPPPRSAASHWLKPIGDDQPKRMFPPSSIAEVAAGVNRESPPVREPKRAPQRAKAKPVELKEKPKSDETVRSPTSIWVATPGDRSTLGQIFGEKLVVHPDLGVILERHSGSMAMTYSGNIEFPSRKASPEDVVTSMEIHRYKPASSFKGMLLLKKALEKGLIGPGDQFALVLEEFRVTDRKHIALVTVRGDAFHVEPLSFEDFVGEERRCVAVRTRQGS